MLKETTYKEPPFKRGDLVPYRSNKAAMSRLGPGSFLDTLLYKGLVCQLFPS